MINNDTNRPSTSATQTLKDKWSESSSKKEKAKVIAVGVLATASSVAGVGFFSKKIFRKVVEKGLGELSEKRESQDKKVGQKGREALDVVGLNNVDDEKTEADFSEQRERLLKNLEPQSTITNHFGGKTTLEPLLKAIENTKPEDKTAMSGRLKIINNFLETSAPRSIFGGTPLHPSKTQPPTRVDCKQVVLKIIPEENKYLADSMVEVLESYRKI